MPRSVLSGVVRVSPVLLLGLILVSSCGEGTDTAGKPEDTSPNKTEQIRTNPIDPDLSNMVYVEGGAFQMGSNDNKPDERPVHEVTVNGFWMETHEVTNEQFAKFVEETDYKTSADDFKNSIVFTGSEGPVDLRNVSAWWEIRDGTNWRHPEGPGSDIEGRMDHPVVHVSWEDAMAYAEWAGKSLPTEAQWEYAAKKGLTGDPKLPQANIFHGEFPYNNTVKDGYEATAPVGSFPPNSLGLYDMAGNVWEWCTDWYRYDYYSNSPKDNPTGPNSSLDPDEPNSPKKTIRGGSFLCHETYCSGFLPSTRMKTPPTDSHSHTGFRCVVNGR
ncbi:MAG: formylglycine-generating enzyme family protein [Armatimonadetes bacterium]|nr:formylglycine-generating enzyme family protein [Armatimonadota bacterium]